MKREDAESSSPDTESESSPAIESDLDTDHGFVEFNTGRIYNGSLAKQVYIFPTPERSDMEVTIGTWWPCYGLSLRGECFDLEVDCGSKIMQKHIIIWSITTLEEVIILNWKFI